MRRKEEGRDKRTWERGKKKEREKEEKREKEKKRYRAF